MHKIVLTIATVMSVGALTILAPNTAQARFGAGAIAAAITNVSSAQPAQYRASRRYPGAYGAYGSAYGAYAYQPSPYRNYWYNAPASVYSGSREALDTCSLC